MLLRSDVDIEGNIRPSPSFPPTSSRRLRSQGEIAARSTDEVLTTPPSLHQIEMSLNSDIQPILLGCEVCSCCKREGSWRACLILGTMAASKLPPESHGSTFTNILVALSCRSESSNKS